MYTGANRPNGGSCERELNLDASTACRVMHLDWVGNVGCGFPNLVCRVHVHFDQACSAHAWKRCRLIISQALLFASRHGAIPRTASAPSAGEAHAEESL